MNKHYYLVRRYTIFRDGQNWLFCNQNKEHNRKPFFKNNTGSKKAVFMLFADHDQRWMGQENKKKWQRTLTIYPARKNSEKRHKGENVTISVLNKKSLPETSAKIRAWQSGQTLGTFMHIRNIWNVGNVPDVSNVPDVPLHIYMSLPRR